MYMYYVICTIKLCGENVASYWGESGDSVYCRCNQHMEAIGKRDEKTILLRNTLPFTILTKQVTKKHLSSDLRNHTTNPSQDYAANLTISTGAAPRSR